MPKLLAITASPRGADSISNALTQTFVDAFTQAHAGTEVITRDLYKTELPFVDPPWIAGAYTPAETHSPEVAKAIAISNDLIAELQSVDHIVLGTPMYNFSVPAILKAYIDHVVRVGVTVSRAYEGQVKGKKLTIIITSGSLYTPGSPTEAYNAESSYLKQIFGFIGLTDMEIILAGGAGAIASGQRTKADLLTDFVPQVQAAAAR